MGGNEMSAEELQSKVEELLARLDAVWLDMSRDSFERPIGAWCNAVSDASDMIKELAQAKAVQWIECAERLPDCDCCDDPACDWSREVVIETNKGHCFVARLEAGQWLVRDSEDTIAWSGTQDEPVRWMPLPARQQENTDDR